MTTLKISASFPQLDGRPWASILGDWDGVTTHQILGWGSSGVVVGVVEGSWGLREILFL